MKGYLLFFFLFVFARPLRAQDVRSSVDKNRILIGEQFHLLLEANFKAGQKTAWFRFDSFPHFEILQSTGVDTQQLTKSITLSQKFTLTSWDSGVQRLPALSLVLPGKNLRTEPIAIDVSFSPMDPDQPYHDVKDILNVEKPYDSKWYWYLLGALMLIALFFLFFPKGRKPDKAEFVPDENAYAAALKKLKILKQQPVTDSKLFFSEMVHIFREYLHRRKNIHSFSKTTDDLALQVGALEMQPGLYKSLLQTLRLSDLVKFAQFQPDHGVHNEAVTVVEESIREIESLN